MKTNKLTKKIIVSTLAVAMGAALVGSISGTVAWYQYSTRVTAQMSGTSAGTSRNLQISETDAAPTASAWEYNVKNNKANMAPSTVTFDDDGVVNGHYEHPVYQYFNGWKVADTADYFSYDLYFQSLKEGNVREAVDVYLTAFEITTTSDNVIKDALRVEFSVYTYTAGDWALSADSNKILALSDEDTATTTVSDYLNLNNRAGGENYVMDKDGFAADDSDGSFKKYQASTAVEKEAGDSGTGLFLDPALKNAAPATLTADGTYYKLGAENYTTVKPDTLLTNDDDPYTFKDASDNEVDGTTKLFSTSTDAAHAVRLTVKVWIEGWQQGDAVEHKTANSNALPEGTDTTGYYQEEECENAAVNSHQVAVSAGADPDGYYKDAACTQAPDDLDGEGKIANDGDYYVKGAAADGTYFEKGYIWDDTTIGTGFTLNMRFGCEADR